MHDNNSKTLGDKSFLAVWIGYGPSTAILLYWDHNKDNYDQCHHGIIDGYNFPIKDAPGQILLDKYAISINEKLSSSKKT